MNSLKCLLWIVIFVPTNVWATSNQESNYSIASYEIEIQPNFQDQSIEGKTLIRLESKVKDLTSISFPLYGLKIKSVSIDSKKAKFDTTAERMTIQIPSSIKSNFEIEVLYNGHPLKGLVFGKDYVYTNFDSCGWMICDENPGQRASFKISLIVPRKYSALSNGSLIHSLDMNNGLKKETWVELKPYSSYLYGFVAGKLVVAETKSKNINLKFFGIQDDSASLLRKFKDTGKVIDFFESKSGVPFSHKSYTQVLIPENEAQEKNGFAILGKAFIDPIDEDPSEDWAIVHELSHQWWGNLLTCKTWKDFWLNEGITVFMTAAYKQQAWGEAAYQRELDLARKRYQVAIDMKFDVPLTFDGNYPSLQIKRAITYSKGMLFMDALRKEVGETVFWNGLKMYTKANVLKSVVSKDFQTSMEKSARQSLDKIFNKWVY